MKKHFFLLTILGIIGFTGCNKDTDNVQPEEQTSPEETPAPVVVETIGCDIEEFCAYSSETKGVSVTLLPDDAEDKSFQWSVLDESIATIEDNVITTHSVGKTWIYAIANADSKIKDSIKITVYANPQKLVSVSDEKIHHEGRIIIDSESAQYLYPGTSFSTEFTGTAISGKFNPVAAYYWVEVDDQEPFKICTSKKNNRVPNSEQNPATFWLARGLEDGNHTVRVTLCSEGLYKNPKFYGFVIEDDAELTKPAEKSVKFEFIGNSITCGYGTEVTDRSPFNDSTSNFCHSFAYKTTKEFNAECMVVARSGIGVYRNYGNQADFGIMPDVYEKSWLSSSTTWDFSQYTPDVVFINLGTNDVWNMDTFSEEDFETAFRNFLNTVISHYPNSKYILLTGCMMNGAGLTKVKAILNAIQSDYNSESHPFYRFDFKTVAGTGADWHPCAAQQDKMGTDLIKFLKDNGIVQ
jgi:archaellum component FlaF (FlaF/FlaG flagellin family)